MANRKKGARGRSRKRRSSPSHAGAGTASEVQASTSPGSAAKAAVEPSTKARARSSQSARRRERSSSSKPDDGYRAPGSVGERPRAPWHPFPLAELLIFVGLIAVAIGAARGESGKPLLFVGIGVVVIGTLDTTIREHLSGYRSHAGLLASVPTALFHGGAALALYALGAPRITWVLVPIAIDVPLFSVLLKMLRARFDDARRERVFAAQH
ncbi:MAG TPA: hypothetical protein VGH21_08375 [Solirubrobacteraceae bacterium]